MPSDCSHYHLVLISHFVAPTCAKTHRTASHRIYSPVLHMQTCLSCFKSDGDGIPQSAHAASPLQRAASPAQTGAEHGSTAELAWMRVTTWKHSRRLTLSVAPVWCSPASLRGHRSVEPVREASSFRKKFNQKSYWQWQAPVLDILDSSSCDIFHFGPADVTSCLSKPAQTSPGMRRGVRRGRECSCRVHKVTPKCSIRHARYSSKRQLSSHLAHSSDVPYFYIHRPIHNPPHPPPPVWCAEVHFLMRSTHLRPHYATKTHHHCAFYNVCRVYITAGEHKQQRQHWRQWKAAVSFICLIFVQVKVKSGPQQVILFYLQENLLLWFGLCLHVGFKVKPCFKDLTSI